MCSTGVIADGCPLSLVTTLTLSIFTSSQSNPVCLGIETPAERPPPPPPPPSPLPPKELDGDCSVFADAAGRPPDPLEPQHPPSARRRRASAPAAITAAARTT